MDTHESKLEEIMLEEFPFGLIISDLVGMGGAVKISSPKDAAAVIESLQRYLEMLESNK